MKKISFKGASWDSFFLTAVKIVTTLSTIVLTKILSTGLSLAQYGTYSSANIVIALGTSVLLLGFGDAINYFYRLFNVNPFEDSVTFKTLPDSEGSLQRQILKMHDIQYQGYGY